MSLTFEGVCDVGGINSGNRGWELGDVELKWVDGSVANFNSQPIDFLKNNAFFVVGV